MIYCYICIGISIINLAYSIFVFLKIKNNDLVQDPLNKEKLSERFEKACNKYLIFPFISLIVVTILYSVASFGKYHEGRYSSPYYMAVIDSFIFVLCMVLIYFLCHGLSKKIKESGEEMDREKKSKIYGLVAAYGVFINVFFIAIAECVYLLLKMCNG